MKKNLLILLLSSLLVITSCGGSDDPHEPGQQETTKYTVTFKNTAMPNVEIEEGGKLYKPEDPIKSGYMFVGWYLDSSFNNEVSFPLTINSNTTIYANFYSYKEAFQKARNNTIGNQVPGYEYDYTLKITASVAGVEFHGNTEGNSKYNSKSSDVTFYDSHVNSGSLFYDGTKYTMKKGRELHVVTLNERDEINNYNIKDVGDNYKYDSSSFAKAIFEYDDSSIKEITATSTVNEYLLKTSFNFSQALTIIANYVNHPLVESILGPLPATSADCKMYVTFNNDKLDSYKYLMTINVTQIKFTLEYKLNFKNAGSAPTITPKSFNNTYISSSDINSKKNEINGYLNAYKNLEHSSYDFKVKTGVDYEGKNSIDATIDGLTRRKVAGGSVYYLNDYEVDTDHKNADLYKSSGLADCHGARVKLSNGEVHDLKKKSIVNGYTDVGVASHNSIDDYYLLDVLEMVSKITYIKIETTTKDITYIIGADTSSVANIIKTFNNSLRLNPLKECSKDVKAFGTFNESSIEVNKFNFKMIFTNSSLSKISLETDGKIITKFEGSRDFTNSKNAKYSLSYTLEVNDDGSKYEPASKVDDVKK